MPEVYPTKKPSTWAWFVVHVAYPLLPFFIEGIIRFIAFGFSLSLGTFNGATLSISLGLLSVAVNQSLLTSERPLSDVTEVESARVAATFFLGFAIVSFCFFAVLVLLSALLQHAPSESIERVTHAFESVVFIGWIIPIIAAITAQKSFKLRAVL
jgi:hypothetical protein